MTTYQLDISCSRRGLLRRAAVATGAGVLMVTHSPPAAARCDRVLELTAQGVRLSVAA